ncbi:ARM repeat-containing protein [Ascobolus immersus RN42]|uniref:ARM repeat-containing protein n=1 Tax=Ascobolus immersus RN42 TaxID=1160509 RepID=A0A3N4IRH2_ASCIM|nr:ARM repeat-containing protein [Ascobolus immersus RN42]
MRIGLSSAHNALYAQSFSCIGHLIRRVSLQDPTKLRGQTRETLPLLVEKLGDSRDKYRRQAISCLIDFWKHCQTEVEKTVKELGFPNKNPRTRESCMTLLAHLHKSVPGFSFRTYVPSMVKLLEDADAHVRDTTKEVVVELFRNAPGHAKVDLKKELTKNNVRKAIASYVLNNLGIADDAEPMRSTSRTGLRQADDDQMAPPMAPSTSRGGGAGGQTPSVGGSQASTMFLQTIPGYELETMEPVYINTNRELEDEFQAMLPCYEGKESEANWAKREKNVIRLRQMLRGNAFRDFQTTFMAGIKMLLDGIIKSTNSLRTTLSTCGCYLLKDLATITGPCLDPMVDIIITCLIKLCANTKKITSANGNLATAVLLANISYHPKLMNYIWLACQDKNVQPRTYATGWLRIMLETHADHKGQIEHSGGAETMEKCLKKGLTDANPGVRESMRPTFWKFAQMFPDRATSIMSSLEGANRTLLEKTNPTAAAAIAAKISSAGAKPARAAGPSRTSVKDAIMAQRRAAAAKLERSETDPVQAAAPARPQRMPPKSKSVAQLSEAAPLRSGSPAPTVSSQRTAKSPTPRSPPPPELRGSVRNLARSNTPSNARRLTVLEQLNHSDYRVRVEGLVVVACLLNNKVPPNCDPHKLPQLPPQDTLGPSLQKLLFDNHTEVVEQVVSPEVLVLLMKVVPKDQILTKVLLLSEGDDGEHVQPAATSSLPALKSLLGQAEAAELVVNCLNSMGASGIVPRKLATGATFPPRDKKRIIHGCLVWMNEIIETFLNGCPNEYLADVGNFKMYVNRFISMLNSTKHPNVQPLYTLLKNIRQIDIEQFDRILYTFDSQTIKELHRAWGQEPEDEPAPAEEAVADVEQVLGSVPNINGNGDVYDGGMNVDEEITMIQPVSAFANDPDFLRDLSIEDKEKDKDKDTEMAPPPPAPLLPSALPDDMEVDKPEPTPQQEPPAVELRRIVSGPPAGTEEWFRSKTQMPDGSEMPKPAQKQIHTLGTLIGRIRSREVDGHAFRKLITIARENPVAPALQDATNVSSPTTTSTIDIWDSGATFDELMHVLLDYLNDDTIDPEKSADLRIQALLVLRQLHSKAKPHFVHHEPRVLTTLIFLRGKYPSHAHVTTGIIELTDDLVETTTNPALGIDTLLSYLETPAPASSNIHGTCLALSALATFIKAGGMAGNYIEQLANLERLGDLVVKNMEAEDAEVRRATVGVACELQRLVGDDRRLFEEVLKGLSAAKQGLLMYYFARSGGTS